MEICSVNCQLANAEWTQSIVTAYSKKYPEHGLTDSDALNAALFEMNPEEYANYVLNGEVNPFSK